ncbi:MAG: OmpH family outer membrane protein [Planctomycetota bacterium]
MQHFRQKLVLAAIAALMLGMGLGGARPVAGAVERMLAQPTPVATVDLFLVIDGLDEFRQQRQQLESRRDGIQALIQQLTTEIEDKAGDLEKLDPQSDAFDEGRRELRMLQATRDTRAQVLQQNLAEDNARALKELYEKTLTAVDQVAERDGWQIVVHTGQQKGVPRNPGVPANQAVLFVEDWIQSRRVIYSNDSVDITQSVVRLMNNQFAAGPVQP